MTQRLKTIVGCAVLDSEKTGEVSAMSNQRRSCPLSAAFVALSAIVGAIVGLFVSPGEGNLSTYN
jgi:hypothetical protein